MTALTLSFQETQFDVVDCNGQPWLRSTQIGDALGYADQSSINRIFARNRDEFTDSMAASVKLTDPNGDLQETRIFSLRGCHLLSMFARTKVAKEFRKWVLDILDKEVSHQPLSNTEEFNHGGNHHTTDTITPEQQGILFNLMAIRFPDGRDRPYCWSRFNRHFVVSSYKNLPASKFAEACIYIPSMPDKEVKALPAPDLSTLIPRLEWTQPDPINGINSVRDYVAAENLIMELKAWADSLPRDIGSPLRGALNDLDNLLVTGWTEMNKAMNHFAQGMNYLHRWQGRNVR